MTTAAEYEALARRCETEAASFALDQAIEALIKGDAACAVPWPYTANLTAARSLSNWPILHASDIGADGLTLVVLGDLSTAPPREAKGIGGRTLELTWCAAALRARAMEAGATPDVTPAEGRKEPSKLDILRIDPRDHDRPVYVIIHSLFPEGTPPEEMEYDVIGAPADIFANFEAIIVDGEVDGQMFGYVRTVDRPAFLDRAHGMEEWRAIVPEAFEPNRSEKP